MVKNPKNIIVSCGVVVGVIVSLIGFVGLVVWAQQGPRTASSVQQTQQQTPMIDKLAVTLLDPKDWKQTSQTFDFLSTPVGYRYPADWSIAVLGKSGHPNHATLTGPRDGECIKMTVSSGENDLDNGLKQVVDNFDVLDSELETTASTSFNVNNKPAKIISVQRDDKEILAAAVDLGKDTRFAGNNVYLLVTTCGTAGADVLYTVIKNIRNE